MEDELKSRGAQPGNRNAVKPDREKRTAKTFVFSTLVERQKWLSAAEKKGISLSEWMRSRANGDL